ncbi:MAG: xanthine dehydrogenase family protein molybdopterin-binding subunit [Rhodospirillaceae bacterium]|jgi:aerobic carbon-monoxide dehydrogenase large subunit|nr:xanthine dehydrogenase family protein molybdopterin-binding subunit [Rhodospirillaceae bacterium]MBT5239953.1 xanthine dehydrogenase family protein molybdopterin-binding subunit [Rhodospirillaceae bacterium]MBT5564385.1 xanthine dehydrogenase family protein molybdopterin-binding subunit [Rhodospirillaceae bacterium]MBT6090052.1 xanthine dehydrogenase family protein molybdopterin-binding subunit [Rhodospirillaceae bacterium]
MGKFGMGQPIRRIEDQRFVTGTGQYTDDVNRPNQSWMAVLRSPYAHADVKSIDTTAAKVAVGVLGVFVNTDLEAAGFTDMPADSIPPGPDGTAPEAPHRPILAKDRVRYVGEPVAVVVAETLDQARDASELIEVDYDERPVVADMKSALADGAPQLFDDFTGNLLVHWSMGDKDATEAAFAKADKIVAIDLVNNRIAPTAIEPRGALAEYDGDRYTLTTGTQGSHKLREWITGKKGKKAANIPVEKLRVICPDVGGGFGMKNFLFNEPLAALFATKAVGRPVKWTGDRTESFLNDTHGRDQINHAELAVSKEGRFLAIRVSSLGNVGAYISQFGAMIPTMAGCGMLCGCYDLEAAHVDVKVTMTNTAPVDAYRGAGRPEAAYVMERLVDKTARELGIAGDELRRRNFIKPEAFPYKTPLGMPYDSGEYTKLMELAMKRANWSGFEQRRQDAANKGKLRGLGMSYYIEACGGGPTEYARLSVDENGKVLVKSGSQNNGQGQETTFSQLTAETLGIEMDDVEVRMGDTDDIEQGMGTGGSRALAAGGSGVVTTAEALIENGKKVAANLLEAAEVDIEFKDGAFRISGTDRTTSLADVAKASFDDSLRPDDVEPGLVTVVEQPPVAPTFPNGCHLCEIEIDQDTGEIEFINYVIEDDIGCILNPLMLEGQILGGAGQGIGQALYEETVYDETGQLVNGSFMDYIMPRADNIPPFDFHYTEVPSPSNRLGAKGAGEAGTIGSTPAVANAVIDALAPLGVSDIEMPMTPLKIWQAIQRASTKAA